MQVSDITDEQLEHCDVHPWKAPYHFVSLLAAAEKARRKDRASDVMEMALCEPNHIILRPGQLYRFTALDGCKECAELAAAYKDTP